MSEALRDWIGMVQKPEEQWNLFEVTLQVCRMLGSVSQLEEVRTTVDQITDSVRSKIQPDADAYTVIEALNRTLFEEWEFRANTEDYYNPRNSLLTYVVEERRGIPITLCLVYREVAARVGLHLGCVGMPGHFLLKYRQPARDLFIDAYHRGEILVEDECRERFEDLFGLETPFERKFLGEIGGRAVILRMLMNLKQIYKQRKAYALLLEVLNRRVALLPDPLPEILERGLIHLTLEHYHFALQDLEHFVTHTPDDEMRELISQQLEQVRTLARGN